MKFFQKAGNRLSEWLSASFIVKGLKWIGRGFVKLCDSSFTVNAFRSDSVSPNVTGSLAGRGITGFFSLFTSMGEKWGRAAADESVIISGAKRFISSLAGLSVKVYGSALIAAGVTYGAFSYARLGSVKVVLAAALIIAGILLCLPRVNIRDLFAASLIGRLFRLTESGDDYRVPVAIDYGIAISAGILWGLAAVYLTPLYAAALLFAAAYAVALLMYPELGIYSAVALAPFIPTMALAGLIAVTVVCFVLKLIFSTGYVFSIDATGVLAVVFALLLLVAGITSYSRASSMKIALLEILFIMSYFLIITMFRDRKKLNLLIFVYLTSALFTGFVGLYQKFSGMVDQTWVDSDLFDGLMMRIYSTFENPNVYGEYLLLTVFISGAMAVISKKLVGKIYYGGVTAVLLVNLALTYSRGCYLALIIGLFIIVCFCARKLLILAAAGVLALPLVLPSSIIQRFTSITNLSDSSTSYRINIWRGTLDMLKDFWPFGTGLGSEAYNKIYPRYALAAVTAPHAHCLFLQIAAEMGVGGLLIFLAMIFCFFNENITAFKRMKDWRDRLLTAAFVSAAGGFLFESIFEYTWYNYRVFLIFFMFLAMANSIARLAKEENCD